LTLFLGTQNDSISRNYFQLVRRFSTKFCRTQKPKPRRKPSLMEMAQRGELAQLEAQVKEMQSARDREVQIATSEFAPMLSKIVTPLLALGTVGLTFILFGVIIFVDVDADSKDILIYVLGALTSAVTMVLGYYFGSSAGSKEKSAQLDEIMEKK
jgi:hypothetical protein